MSSGNHKVLFGEYCSASVCSGLRVGFKQIATTGWLNTPSKELSSQAGTSATKSPEPWHVTDGSWIECKALHITLQRWSHLPRQLVFGKAMGVFKAEAAKSLRAERKRRLHSGSSSPDCAELRFLVLAVAAEGLGVSHHSTSSPDGQSHPMSGCSVMTSITKWDK